MEVFDTVAEFVAWIDATLEQLNGPDALAMSSDRWLTVLEQARAAAYALGLPDVAEVLGGPFPPYLFAPDSPAAKAMRDQLRTRLVGLRNCLTGSDSSRQSDTKADTQKKKNRRCGEHEFRCAALYKTARKDGVPIGLAAVISDYLEQNPKVKRKASTIKRTLEANPTVYRV